MVNPCGDDFVHSCCCKCEKKLTDRRGYVLENNIPTCMTCYCTIRTDMCMSCRNMIKSNEHQLSYNNKHWHEDCFKCSRCEENLREKQFIKSGDDSLNCIPCYDEMFSKRCAGCGKKFESENDMFSYGKKEFHQKCFTCSICAKPIGNTAYIPDNKTEDKRTCMTCYKTKVAPKCAVCNDPVAEGGSAFLGKSYHNRCFRCAAETCGRQLADENFAVNDRQPYCIGCYIKAFDPECKKCCRPISGVPHATKYVAFEGQYWHAQCFTCSTCDKNLSGFGFIIHDGDVVCPTCGKQVCAAYV